MNLNHVLKKVGRGRDDDLFIFWYFLNLNHVLKKVGKGRDDDLFIFWYFLNLNHVLKKVGRGRDDDLFIFWYFLNLHALGYPKSVTGFFASTFGSTSPSAWCGWSIYFFVPCELGQCLNTPASTAAVLQSLIFNFLLRLV
jgi:hypothetical protein